MHNLIRRAAVAVGIGVLTSTMAFAAGTPAFAAGTPQVVISHSSNWAGYYSLSDAAIGMALVEFTVPKVNCAVSRGDATPGIGYAGSMWVGLGGMHLSTGSPGNNWLEQAGVQVFCSSLHAQPVYEPFYEIVPTQQDPDSYYHEPVVFDNGKARVHAGDDIGVTIDPPSSSPRPGSWFFAVTTGTGSGYSYRNTKVWTAYPKLPAGTYTGSLNSNAHETVEVVTERPSADHHLTGFVDMGTVSYLYADYLAFPPATSIAVLSIASHPITLEYPNPGPAAVYPGAPYTGAPYVPVPGGAGSGGSGIADDCFKTFYAKNWLR